MVVRLYRPPEIEKKIKETRSGLTSSRYLICLKCKKTLKLHKQKGYCSKKCLLIWEPVKRKIKPPKIKKISSKFYDSDKWRDLRYRVLKKHGRKCMVCFRTNIELHVDHIKPISKYPELSLEQSNLQVLCRDCNLGKSNKDEIDWRP